MVTRALSLVMHVKFPMDMHQCMCFVPCFCHLFFLLGSMFLLITTALVPWSTIFSIAFHAFKKKLNFVLAEDGPYFHMNFRLYFFIVYCMSPCVLEFLLFLIEFLLMCVYIYVCMYVCMVLVWNFFWNYFICYLGLGCICFEFVFSVFIL